MARLVSALVLLVLIAGVCVAAEGENAAYKALRQQVREEALSYSNLVVALTGANNVAKVRDELIVWANKQKAAKEKQAKGGKKEIK